MKDNEPASVIGGLAWQFSDVTNQLEDEDAEFYKRGGAFFYIGYILNQQ